MKHPTQTPQNVSILPAGIRVRRTKDLTKKKEIDYSENDVRLSGQ